MGSPRNSFYVYVKRAIVKGMTLHLSKMQFPSPKKAFVFAVCFGEKDEKMTISI